MLQYLSPLGWEHINLTGDYLWKAGAKMGDGKDSCKKHTDLYFSFTSNFRGARRICSKGSGLRFLLMA